MLIKLKERVWIVDCLTACVVNTINSFICYKSVYCNCIVLRYCKKVAKKNTNKSKTYRFTTPHLSLFLRRTLHSNTNPNQIQCLTTTDRNWLMSDFWGLSEIDLLNAFSGRFPFSASKLRRFRAISPSFSFSVSRLNDHDLLPSSYFRFGMGNELILSSKEGVDSSGDWVRYEDEGWWAGS